MVVSDERCGGRLEKAVVLDVKCAPQGQIIAFVQRVVSSFGKSDEAYRVPMAFSVELHNYENFNI
jgi:hypothetical protein